MTKATKIRLEKIAMEACYAVRDRGGLDERGCDSEDFIETSVWSIQAMLEQAYELGKADAGKKSRR